MSKCVDEGVGSRLHQVLPNVPKQKTQIENTNTMNKSKEEQDFWQNGPLFVGPSMKIKMLLMSLNS